VGGSPKRELPSYDGRPPAGVTATEALLWVPRIALFPAYVVTEYVVRRPVGALTTAVERAQLIELFTDIFTWGPTHNIGLIPTGLIDTGFKPSVGAYFFYDDFLAKGNGLRAHASFGGKDWLRLTLGDHVELSKDSTFKLRVELTHRPDFAYWGTGPRSLYADESRYASDYIDATGTFDSRLIGGLSVRTWVGVKAQQFRDTTCCDEPSIVSLAPTNALPPGFSTGITPMRVGARFAYDPRRPRPEPGTGLRLEAQGELGSDLHAPGSDWVKYGGTIGTYLDLTGQNRVLSLATTVQLIDPLNAKPGGPSEIPFTELVQMGNTGLLQGFHLGRLRGRSSAAVSLEYRYPIWAFLDGDLQVAVGNVFSEHLRDLRAENLRLSWTVGLRSIGERDHSFNILIGGGTETFAQGGKLDEIRFLLGGTEGF
jgi:hypothetical protein